MNLPPAAVKLGEVPKDEVLDEIRMLESMLVRILERGSSVLRAEPDWPTLNRWMIRAHSRHWRTELDWRS